MGLEIQGETNEYDQQIAKWLTAERKDPLWYAIGTDKLIDQYKKCIARYDDYVEK